ncbi:bifunctional 3,4-dihydroxy-2-butanone-4-phosphate synthase/GTP cyclohydrolase II [Amycolatopsis sp. NPDC004079]|uniref:bifunctional 3,4-dihydroxy-2-butanone-4-phosphate synthase/GTP cyclohydrolase II n=1 Tax=Amycolatopsis sp. NPDC004079 TaxID=3154549 RepID=UPI0033B55880
MLAIEDSVRAAVCALEEGRMIVVVDDHDRENEGDLVLAADSVTADQMAFLVAHTTGIVCAPMTAERADALALPPMVADNKDVHGTAFTVSVDHADAGTGVSATARARTCRALADPGTVPESLRRPGHIFPLRAQDGGVLVRAGHTEAAVDLLRLAGREAVGVISELIGPDGEMLRDAGVREFAAEHGLPVVTIADLVRQRRTTERLVEPVATAAMPTAFGDFRAIAYRSRVDGAEHLALVMGDVAAAGGSERGALARVHSECLTGDILGSLRCDCGTQLEQAMRAVADEGCGVIVYLRGHEGRGIGLASKIEAYALQETGLDTVDANVAQGLPADSRSYDSGARILDHLGVRRVRLITNNPEKYRGLGDYGLHVTERVALRPVETPHNLRYLRTKRDRMGHAFAALPDPAPRRKTS